MNTIKDVNKKIVIASLIVTFVFTVLLFDTLFYKENTKLKIKDFSYLSSNTPSEVYTKEEVESLQNITKLNDLKLENNKMLTLGGNSYLEFDLNMKANTLSFSIDTTMSQDVPIQLYYAMDGEEFSQENSVTKILTTDIEKLMFTLPQDQYSKVRLKLADVAGEQFEISDLNISYIGYSYGGFNEWLSIELVFLLSWFGLLSLDKIMNKKRNKIALMLTGKFNKMIWRSIVSLLVLLGIPSIYYCANIYVPFQTIKNNIDIDMQDVAYIDINQEGKLLTTTSNDPYFIINNVNEKVQNINFYVDHCDSVFPLTIYIDNGQGFSETNTKYFTLRNGYNSLSFVPQYIKNLRLDPSSQKNFNFSISEVRINENGFDFSKLLILIPFAILMYFLGKKGKYFYTLICVEAIAYYLLFALYYRHSFSKPIIWIFMTAILGVLFIAMNVKENGNEEKNIE